MTAPAPIRTPARWLPLEDHPAALSPLDVGIVRVGLEGRVRALLHALHLPDTDSLSTRLLTQQGGRLAVHAAHLDTLTAALSAEQILAVHVALGIAADAGPPAVPSARPRPEFIQQAAPGTRSVAQPGVSRPADSPATVLARAIVAHADDLGVLTAYNAALVTEALRGVTWHWLEQRSALHLELLCGLDTVGGAGAELASAAMHQVQSTLSGGRRSAARGLIDAARTQHAALAAHHAAQRQTRRAVIRASVQVASVLSRAGWLNRPADARWLTPTELRDALDGTLDPATLRGLTQLRRFQHAPPPPTPTWTLVDRQYSVVPLSPGVRDGELHVWIPGQPVPGGSIVLCEEARPWHRAQLAEAAAVILDRAGPLSSAALHERGAGRPAVSLRGRRPEWLQPGAYVRVNAHQGTVTLLRRADDALAGASTPAESPVAGGHGPATAHPADEVVLAGPPAAVPARAVPSELTAISLDFDPV
ncbi:MULTISPECIES: PEP-utilizing enzyme [Deinococcus]|uniref:PEP-utilizing enzyme n=1 Tax=Deinococcus rufus TaxID=2136097 RepID=A0ABV7ZDR2_9DEIO|nr:PEP-utilizing enzyme [Deinococcus sp. AB2017081]WQE94319.1 PEP-utilizing enzyme [Deinococcus sp. AB2017081]